LSDILDVECAGSRYQAMTNLAVWVDRALSDGIQQL